MFNRRLDSAINPCFPGIFKSTQPIFFTFLIGYKLRKSGKRTTDGTTDGTTNGTTYHFDLQLLIQRSGPPMIPPTVPPFPFYIINKDIIKGSFPFRKTFLTPKLDFEVRFRSSISQPNFDRLACPADPKSRNRTTETEQIGGVRKSVQPKFDFAARFHSSILTAPRTLPTRRAETEPRKRNEPAAKDALPAEARFRSLISQPNFDRLACPADPKSRNRTTETEQIGGVRKSAQPKFDFTARFRSSISQPNFDRPACSADPKSRNRTTETE